MSGYEWQPSAYPQPYAPTAPAYYPPMYPATMQPPSFPTPQTGASAYPFVQMPMQPTYYPTAQPSIFPPNPQQFFMMPEYGESSDRDE
jgi:morphogenetic protein associated with SpoVID